MSVSVGYSAKRLIETSGGNNRLTAAVRQVRHGAAAVFAERGRKASGQWQVETHDGLFSPKPSKRQRSQSPRKNARCRSLIGNVNNGSSGIDRMVPRLRTRPRRTGNSPGMLPFLFPHRYESLQVASRCEIDFHPNKKPGLATGLFHFIA
jgi:hypothetical protein